MIAVAAQVSKAGLLYTAVQADLVSIEQVFHEVADPGLGVNALPDSLVVALADSEAFSLGHFRQDGFAFRRHPDNNTLCLA